MLLTKYSRLDFAAGAVAGAEMTARIFDLGTGHDATEVRVSILLT